MVEIPGINGEPTIKIFDDLKELRSQCGEKLTHGYFDPSQNLILATVASVAHEIGHYRDFKSGKMKPLSSLLSSEDRSNQIIRNEIVAILFSYQRVSDRYGLITYERDFIEWVVYQWDRAKEFGLWKSKAAHVSQLKFGDLQDLAAWLVEPQHPWADQLKIMFATYLKSETEIMMYSF